MSESEHGGSCCGGPAVFPPDEVEVLQADDFDAAKHIAYLMVGIFTLGLLGYLVVALWVWSQPPAII